MNAIAPIGHNGGPDLLGEAIGTDPEARELAEGLLTGDPVTTEAQMKATDAVAKRIKAILKAVNDARDTETKPLHTAWKEACDRYKPTQDDLDRQVKGLAAMVNDFKRKLAAEKAEAERKAREEQARAEAELRRKREEAAASDLEAQRAIAEQERAVKEAQIEARKAASAAKDVKGLRTVTRYEIEDHRALLNWIAKNRREDLTAFIENWALKNHKKNQTAEGLRVWTEEEAF